MKFVIHEERLYSIVQPSPNLFHSSMVREVYTRGDFMAVDLITGTLTILPGWVRNHRRMISRASHSNCEFEMGAIARKILKHLLEVTSDTAVIRRVDARLADTLQEEQINLNDAKLAINDLQVQLEGRISATAIAFEGIDEMQGRSLARGGFTAGTSIKRSRGVLNEAAALVVIKTADERKDGLTLLRKLEEVYLPKEEAVVAFVPVSKAEGTASAVEEAAPVSKPRAKRVRKNDAPKE